MRHLPLYFFLALLGWAISATLEPCQDRLLHRIEESRFVEHAAVALDGGIAATLTSSSHEDERDRTTSSFYLTVYSTRDGKPLTKEMHLYTRRSPKHRHPTPPDGPFVTPDGAYVLTACYFPHQEIRIYDVKAGRFLPHVAVPAVGGNDWSASETGLVSYRTWKGYFILEAATGRVVRSFQSETPEFRPGRVRLSPDGAHVAMAGNDGLWLAPAHGEGEPKRVYSGRTSHPNFVPSRKQIVFVGDGGVVTYDLARDRVVGSPLKGTYENVHVSADGKVAIAGDRKGVDVLDLSAGKVRCRRERPMPYSLSDLEFLSAKGDKVLAAEADDRSVRLLVWNPLNGRELFTLQTGKTRAPLAISKDGQVGAAFSYDDVSLWKL